MEFDCPYLDMFVFLSASAKAKSSAAGRQDSEDEEAVDTIEVR